MKIFFITLLLVLLQHSAFAQDTKLLKKISAYLDSNKSHIALINDTSEEGLNRQTLAVIPLSDVQNLMAPKMHQL